MVTDGWSQFFEAPCSQTTPESDEDGVEQREAQPFPTRGHAADAAGTGLPAEFRPSWLVADQRFSDIARSRH